MKTRTRARIRRVSDRSCSSRHTSARRTQTLGDLSGPKPDRPDFSPGGLVRTRLAVAFALIALFVSMLTPSPSAAGRLHPTFPLLDETGESVQISGRPVSPLRSCGTCHDTEFIAAHDSHTTAGSGLDCFLCHIPNADDRARRAALANGHPEWSATATLAATGIVEPIGVVNSMGGVEGDGTFRYVDAAFDERGHVQQSYLSLQDPKSDACGSCHGAVHLDLTQPFSWPEADENSEPPWTTLQTGQIFSPQSILDSGLNLEGKTRLSRGWDAHAERGLDCVDCHYSDNNPIYRRASGARPDHLRFDARRIDLGEYLERPSHVLAHGVEPGESEGTMRGCATCHDARVGHDWLPYADRHFATLSCTACHVPELRAPALASIDATVVDPTGAPRVTLRGVDGPPVWGFDLGPTTAATYFRGYEPVLLPRLEADGTIRLAPHNLVTTFRWVEGDPGTEIPSARIASLLYDRAGRPRTDLLPIFDSNADGHWSGGELQVGNVEQEARLVSALREQGAIDPRIDAVAVAHPITHGVTSGVWALRECAQCHESGSRIDRSVVLADPAPGSAVPRMEGDARIDLAGSAERAPNGQLRFVPAGRASLYVLGRHANEVMNRIGLFSVLLVLLGIGAHASLRAVRGRGSSSMATSADSSTSPQAAGGSTGGGRAVYMYSAYERFWHWLQAGAVLLLLLTGLEVHFPGSLSLFGFGLAVRTHNIVAFVVVVNAALAAFYHFASGEIRQFLPEPRGFFRGAILQVRYYLFGIFRGEPHPFEKHPGQKMNVLQQVTYLAILNLLFPLQIGTGLLIWGAQRWQTVDSVFGGLGVIGPIHALGAWLFAAFLAVHIYLTTTGPTPAAYVKAMVTGWEEESGAHQPAPSQPRTLTSPAEARS